MKMSESIKPISYFKSHAAHIIKELAENHATMIITQNGEAKAIVQDIQTYEETQESLALLKMIAQSKTSIEAGNYRKSSDVFKDLKSSIEK